MALIAAIDQGTSSSRVLVFNAEGAVVASAQLELPLITPHQGWVEQDPLQILGTVQTCMRQAEAQLVEKGYVPKRDLKAIGIANQRETTIVWDAATGQPLHPAISTQRRLPAYIGTVWLDVRTAETVHKLEQACDGNRRKFQDRCGLPLATYFSAVKLRWLLDHPTPALTDALAHKRARFGTVDAWLLWHLTGGSEGGVHVTDVTNASRTMLMNLHTLQWDPELCSFFGVEPWMLPAIRSSAEVYGTVHPSQGAMAGVPIAGCAGDQQAALLGHRCVRTGEAKNTYGTGCFLLFNTGPQPVISKHGLISTVAYQLGPTQPAHYALEGSVAIAGAALSWLRDSLRILPSYNDVDALASEVADSAGVYFVPALSGLFAPHWREDARGTIIGLSQYSDRRHLVRATLEGVCMQTKEVIDAMNLDSGVPLALLKVDGGMTKSAVCMQTQADVLGITVERPRMAEMTALGAAMLAGVAVGVWPSLEAIPLKADVDRFHPTLPDAARTKLIGGWTRAVQCALLASAPSE